MKKLFFIFYCIICTVALQAQVLKSKTLSATTAGVPLKTNVQTNNAIAKPVQNPLPNMGSNSPSKPIGGFNQKVPDNISGAYSQAVRTKDGKIINVSYKVHESHLMNNAATEKINKGNTALSKQIIPYSRNKKNGGDDNWNCASEDIKVNIRDDDYMRVPVKAQAANIFPGAIYKFQNYINGQWRNETGNRNPIVISASVENMTGTPQETIQQPDINSTRTAIVNLFSRFTRKAEEIANGGLKVHVEEISSTSDLDIKIGVSGYGGGFSASNNFQLQKKTNSRIFLYDCTKEMFTLDAIQPAKGFFANPNRAETDMMYISSVTYGLRIIALVELEITDEAINNNFKGSYDALTAGGSAAIDVAKRINNNKATVNMFVVGGQSNTAFTEYSIDAMKTRLQDIQRTLTYNNSAPIMYNFRNMKNDVVRYSSATDWFPVTNCEPKSEEEKPADFSAQIQFIRIDNPSEDDVDLYGTIRAELIDGNNNKIGEARGDPYLLNLGGGQFIKREELKNSTGRLPVNDIFFNVGAGNVPGSKLRIYYNLNDKDNSGDDPIVMRGRSPEYINGARYFVQTIYLDEVKKGSPKQYNEGFVDEDNDYPFTITINVEKK
jgi:hypothetical protein